MFVMCYEIFKLQITNTLDEINIERLIAYKRVFIFLCRWVYLFVWKGIVQKCVKYIDINESIQMTKMVPYAFFGPQKNIQKIEALNIEIESLRKDKCTHPGHSA